MNNQTTKPQVQSVLRAVRLNAVRLRREAAIEQAERRSAAFLEARLQQRGKPVLDFAI